MRSKSRGRSIVFILALAMIVGGATSVYGLQNGEKQNAPANEESFYGESKVELSTVTKVKITCDAAGKVLKAENNTTDFSANPSNKAYMDKFVAGNGFKPYENKTREQIKSLQILKPGKTINDVDKGGSVAGTDSVAGATYTGYEVRFAVLNALDERDKSKAVVKYGESSGDPTVQGSTLPYEMLAKVTVDGNGRIIKAEDFGTDPYSNPDNDTAADDVKYLNKYLTKKGYDKFKGKNLEEVKKMQMLPPGGSYGHGPGVDAVAGATACSLAAKGAVIDALKHTKNPTLRRKGGYYHPKKHNNAYELEMINYLPDDYKPVLEKVTYGIFNNEHEPNVEGISLTKDGKKLQFKNELKPGYYTLNIKDESGKHPSFDYTFAGADKFSYPNFVIYEPNKANDVKYEGGKISSKGRSVEDLIKNVESIEIRDEEDEDILMSVPIMDEDDGLNVKYINGDYAKNPFFTKDGKINPDFKDLKGKNIFEDGKKYSIHVYFWNVKSKFSTMYAKNAEPTAPEKVAALIDALDSANPDKAAVAAARKAYDALTAEEKKTIADKYIKLLEIEKGLAEKEAAEAKAKAEEKEKEAQKAKEEAEKLKNEAEKAKAEAEKLKNETEKAKAEVEKLKNEAEKANKEAKKNKDEIEKLKNEASKSKEEASKFSAEANKSKDEIAKVQREIESLKAEQNKAQKTKGTDDSTTLKIRGLKINALKNHKFKISWKPLSGIAGYRVVYRTVKSKTFKTVKTTKLSSVKSKALKRGQKYIFKVRAYKIVNGEKVYGMWSPAKKLRCR